MVSSLRNAGVGGLASPPVEPEKASDTLPTPVYSPLEALGEPGPRSRLGSRGVKVGGVLEFGPDLGQESGRASAGRAGAQGSGFCHSPEFLGASRSPQPPAA